METPKTTPPLVPHKPEAPLLPPVLTGASAYLWLWILPIGLLLLLNLQGYGLIEGNMEDAERSSAHWLGFSNLLNLGIGIALYLVARARGKTSDCLSTLWALPVIAVQIAYLWQATANVDNILPRSVTIWIYPHARFFYNHYAFCMLPLAWGVIRVACGNASFLSKSIGKNVLIAIFMPVTLFIGMKIMSPFGNWDFVRTISPVIVACIVIVLSILMFVALIRALMLIFKGLDEWAPNKQLIGITLIALCMPIGGLLLNRTIPFPVNFQAWEIYALVVVNTAFLMWATLGVRSAPRLSFYLLSASFPFTLYFFVVFLPYTPLAMLGCIVMGAGFLVLTPTVLFTLHLYHLVQAQRVAREQDNARTLVIGGLLCFLLLPAFFTSRSLMDKAALNSALDFVYTPNLESKSIEYPGNRLNLKRALASHRNYKNGIYYPLLSDAYSWLVFDNLVLPDDKIKQLELTFFGEWGSSKNMDPVNRGMDLWGRGSVRSRSSMPRSTPPSRKVDLIKQDLQLSAANEGNTQATLTLTLENASPEGTWGGAEYINKLSIPPGVLINGFRLHINGTPVPGRIFEKKTALWVYTMIRDTERRDPGLLVYNNPQEVELRVFPIMKDAPATVEIDFLIPDDIDAIHAPEVLPNPAELIPKLYPTRAQVATGSDFTYIAPLDIDSLPKVKREQNLHLIIDRSQHNGFEGTAEEARQLTREKFPNLQASRITLANYNVLELAEDFGMDSLPIGGGFDLDKALAHSIARYSSEVLDSRNDTLPTEPIFIIVGRTALQELPELEKTKIWQSQLSALQIYSAGLENTVLKPLTPEVDSARPIIRVGNSLRPAHSRRSLLFTYFPDFDAPAPEYYDPDSPAGWHPLEYDHHAADDQWTQAIELWVRNHRYAASPGSATATLKDLVAASRRSGVLLPATSYIVVENEAQWRMLEKKEGQKLEQNEALDFLETPAPSGLILVLGFGLWIGWRKMQEQSQR